MRVYSIYIQSTAKVWTIPRREVYFSDAVFIFSVNVVVYPFLAPRLT
jgi:hypothetical protein